MGTGKKRPRKNLPTASRPDFINLTSAVAIRAGIGGRARGRTQ